jgi:hypothetical protein
LPSWRVHPDAHKQRMHTASGVKWRREAVETLNTANINPKLLRSGRCVGRGVPAKVRAAWSKKVQSARQISPYLGARPR